jgi:hypothetical protein
MQGGKIMTRNEFEKTMLGVGMEAQMAPGTGTDAIPDFVPASESRSDPVGRYKGEWGFWCECWMDWNGGFADEAEARAGLARYCRDVLGMA